MRPVTLTLAKNYTDKKIQESDGGSTGQFVQADWNQNDQSAPDYIKNRIAWVEPGTTTTYTFDGNLEGKEYIYLEEESTDEHKYYLVKIADEAISLEAFESLKLYSFGVEESALKESLPIEVMGTGWAIKLKANSTIPVIVSAEGVEAFGSTLFGTYVLCGTEQLGGIHSPAVCISAVHCSTPEIVHKLEPKYLPEGGFGYEEPGTLLVDDELTTTGDGFTMSYHGGHIGLEVGKKYTVTLDSGTYTAICKRTEFDGYPFYYIGNAGILNIGMPLTEEPFVAVDALDLDTGTEQEARTIVDLGNGKRCVIRTGGIAHKINPEFLPDGGFGYEEPSTILGEYQLNDSGGGELQAHIGLEAGKTYSVTLDSGTYTAVCKTYTAEMSDGKEITSHYIGNFGKWLNNDTIPDTGETFVVIDSWDTANNITFFEISMAIDMNNGTKCIVSSGGEVHGIDPKFLPEGGFGHTSLEAQELTFDGNLEGKEVVSIGNGISLVKISNDAIDVFNIKEIDTMLASDKETISADILLCGEMEPGVQAITFDDELFIASFAKDMTMEGISATAGTWVIFKESVIYISAIRYLDKTVHKIDPKFLPKDGFGWTEKTDGALTFDGNLDGKITSSLSDSYILVKVSDEAIDLGDVQRITIVNRAPTGEEFPYTADSSEFTVAYFLDKLIPCIVSPDNPDVPLVASVPESLLSSASPEEYETIKSLIGTLVLYISPTDGDSDTSYISSVEVTNLSEVHHKIDPKFLPEGVGYKDEDEKVLSASLSPESSGMGLRTYGEFYFSNGIPFVAGEAYIVKTDSGKYDVVATETEGGMILGSLQVETAVSIEQINALPYPFFIGCLSQGDFSGAVIYDGHCGSSIEVRKPGKVHTISAEYLPMETIEEQAATAALSKMGVGIEVKVLTYDGNEEGKTKIEFETLDYVHIGDAIDPKSITEISMLFQGNKVTYTADTFIVEALNEDVTVIKANGPIGVVISNVSPSGTFVLSELSYSSYVTRIKTETIYPIDEKFLPEIDAASLNGKTSNDFALVENLEEVKEKANLFDSCKYLILELLDSIIYTSDKSETISQLKQLLKDLSIKISEIGFGTTSFIEDAGLQINRDTVKGRATLIPVGQYLKKGHTYRFSIGEAVEKYSYGVQIMQASGPDLVFECPLGQTKYFNNVTSRLVDTGWMTNDYQYTATEDNQIFTMNFKITVDGDFTADDYATLLANVVVEEVL